MFEKILRHIRGVSSGHENVSHDRSNDATFELYFGNLLVLVLSVEAGQWKMVYSEDFKKQRHLQPLVPFRDVDKEYTSNELWPFFAIRIPSIARPEVMSKVLKEGLDPNNVAAMLARFGRECIADPYELKPRRSTETDRLEQAVGT